MLDSFSNKCSKWVLQAKGNNLFTSVQRFPQIVDTFVKNKMEKPVSVAIYAWMDMAKVLHFWRKEKKLCERLAAGKQVEGEEYSRCVSGSHAMLVDQFSIFPHSPLGGCVELSDKVGRKSCVVSPLSLFSSVEFQNFLIQFTFLLFTFTLHRHARWHICDIWDTFWHKIKLYYLSFQCFDL